MEKMSSRITFHFAVIFLLILAINPIFASAENEDIFSVELTLEEAVNMAYKNSYELKIKDSEIENLWDNYLAHFEKIKTYEYNLYSIDEYRSMYDRVHSGEILIGSDQLLYFEYMAKYGSTPPYLTNEERFINYIGPMKLLHYEAYSLYQNALDEREVLYLKIAASVESLYKNILDMYTALKIHNENYNNISESTKIINAMYEQGLVSELEVLQANIDLEKQSLSIAQLQRQIDNLEMALKKEIGIPLTANIIIQEAPSDYTDRKPLTHNEYLNMALSNRSEIIIAKRNLNIKQRELNITSEYIKDDKSEILSNARKAVYEREILLKEAEKYVIEDIFFAYSDVMNKYKNFELAKRKKVHAQNELNRVEYQYEKGFISPSQIRDAKQSFIMADINYLNALRNYNYSLKKLELASGLGPAYRN